MAEKSEAPPADAATGEVQEIGSDDVEALPFTKDGAGEDAQMSPVEIEQFLATGQFKGVESGAVVRDASVGTPPLIDQDDLIGAPFVVFQTRLQDAHAEVNGVQVIDYTMVLCVGQAVTLRYIEEPGPDDEPTIEKTGLIFIMIAGRDGSVFGREMLNLAFDATADAPVLFPNGIQKVEKGAGQFYYTSRPERDPTQRVELFPDS